MRICFLALTLLLAACNTPSPTFRGLPAQKVTVDGSTFDIRIRGKLAEAIRTNPQYAPRLGPIEGRAAQAMAMVSGCDVRIVTGDQALMLGQLDCNGRASLYHPGPPITLACDGIWDMTDGHAHARYLDLDCTAQ